MIDTDKYEGHTQGHWATTTRKGTWVVYTQDNGDVATMNDYEDAKLIAVAPLLLAEVKRLREQYTELREALVGDSPNWTHEELIEKVLEIYDKALVFDIIYDFNERMQLQSESYENELWRMDWLLKNPTKEYEDYDKEYDEK
jgi:hypothetical protein